jgi:hypothetical protein
MQKVAEIIESLVKNSEGKAQDHYNHVSSN